MREALISMGSNKALVEFNIRVKEQVVGTSLASTCLKGHVIFFYLSHTAGSRRRWEGNERKEGVVLEGVSVGEGVKQKLI